MGETQNAKFIPFAVEMYGGLGKSAKKLLNMISKCASDQMFDKGYGFYDLRGMNTNYNRQQ